MKRHELSGSAEDVGVFSVVHVSVHVGVGPTVEFKTFRMWLREEGIFDPDSPRNKLTRTPDGENLDGVDDSKIYRRDDLFSFALVFGWDCESTRSDGQRKRVGDDVAVGEIEDGVHSRRGGKYKYYFVWMFRGRVECGVRVGV